MSFRVPAPRKGEHPLEQVDQGVLARLNPVSLRLRPGRSSTRRRPSLAEAVRVSAEPGL